MSVANPATLKEVQNLPQKFIVFCVARVPQTQRLYIGSSDFKVYEIDLAAEKPEPVPFLGEGHESYVTGVALAGNLLVSGGYDGRLIWWETANRKPIRVADAHEKWIRRVVASPDGSLVASIADDMLCKLWDAKTGDELLTLVGHERWVESAVYSPDGARILTASGDQTAKVWDAETGDELLTLAGHRPLVMSAV